MKPCVICNKNETARLMNVAGEKKPVCTECLTSGRWRELLTAPVEEVHTLITDAYFEAGASELEPLPETTESAPGVASDLVCSVCGKECKSLSGLKSHMRTHK